MCTKDTDEINSFVVELTSVSRQKFSELLWTRPFLRLLFFLQRMSYNRQIVLLMWLIRVIRKVTTSQHLSTLCLEEHKKSQGSHNAGWRDIAIAKKDTGNCVLVHPWEENRMPWQRHICSEFAKNTPAFAIREVIALQTSQADIVKLVGYLKPP